MERQDFREEIEGYYSARRATRVARFELVLWVAICVCGFGVISIIVMASGGGLLRVAPAATPKPLPVPVTTAAPALTPTEKLELEAKKEEWRAILKNNRSMLPIFEGMDPSIRARAYADCANARDRARAYLSDSEIEELFPILLLPQR